MRVWATALVLVIIAGATVGCSRETRYEILTFFFTGVPPLDGEGRTAEQAAAVDSQALAQAAALARREESLRLRRAELERALRWSHGPYAAGACGACHSVAGSVAFRSAKSTGAALSAVGSAQQRLIAPKHELCLTCHSEKSADAINARGLRPHAPVGSGLCVGCHSPHQTARRYMLLGEDNVDLCTQCHEKSGIWERTPLHAEAQDPDCLGCHNPHVGRSATVLRSEYDELAEQQ